MQRTVKLAGAAVAVAAIALLAVGAMALWPGRPPDVAREQDVTPESGESAPTPVPATDTAVPPISTAIPPTTTPAPATADLETAATPEMDQVVGDYFDAYNGYDAAALEALITDGYVLYREWDFSDRNVSRPVSAAYDAGTMLWYVERYNKANQCQFERRGETIMSGSGPWLVAQVIRVTSLDFPHGLDGISILTIVDEAGTLKVARDIFEGFEGK